MVPMRESTYFPPLEKCLDGEQLLISWITVFIAQSKDGDCERTYPTLETFLLEPYVLQLLGRPYNPYTITTAQTKSAFETKTAAINVTPTTKKEYDITEIKDDSLWLSKEVQIDEISALRIVVLEYQTRASEQLRCDFSDEEVANLDEAGGSIGAEIPALVPRISHFTGSTAERSLHFNSMDKRRLRTIRIYLSERRYLLKCAGLFLQAALDQRKGLDDNSDNESGKNSAEVGNTSWSYHIGENLLAFLEQSGRSMHDCLIDTIRSLRARFQSLENGSGWFKQEGGREDLEIEWLTSNIIEAVHTMEIVFRILDSQAQVPSSEVVLEWFRFVSAFGFFDQFETPYHSMKPKISSLQSLVAVISLSLLDPQRAIESFYDTHDVTQTSENQNHTPYISDFQALTDLHKFLLDAASRLSPLASPAVLAWSIILKTMRDTTLARKEARELRQSVHAEEYLEDESSFDDDALPGTRSEHPKPTRRYSASSEASGEAGIYDNFLETIRDTTSDGDPILYLGSSAIEGSNVFEVLTSLAEFFGASTYSDIMGIKIRLVVLALTRCSIEVLDYTPEVVSTTLAVLSGDKDFWDLLEGQPALASEDPLAIFLEDEYLVQRLLETAMSRYPYERLPFMKLIRAVAGCRTLHDDGTPIAAKILERIPSFTFQLPQDFRDYETIQEEDNANTIQLTDDVLLFQPRHSIRLTNKKLDTHSVSSVLSQTSQEFSIVEGTPGRIVSDSDSGPKVAIWFQEYSGLKYMGKLLETALTASNYVDATSGEVIDRESITEVIGLLATLLYTTTKIGRSNKGDLDSNACAHRILEDASDGLDRNRDIVTVIFKIFEEELQRQSASSDNEGSLEVLVASIQFIFALVPILPGRVWPLLGRSDLLDMDGRGGRLAAILGRVEMVSCRYDFLLSCTRLFQALVDDSIKHAVSRKVGSKSLVRHGSKEDNGTGVPEQILSKVLLSFTRALVDVFESSFNWRFAVQKQRLQLSELISTVLHSILYHTHGVDDWPTLDAKLTKPLMPAASYIIDSFLATTPDQMRFRPILRTFLDGFSDPDLTFQSVLEIHWLGEVKAALNFSTTLVKISMLLDRPTSQLEHQLFKISPLIARLYAINEAYHLAVIKLLEALVLGASSKEGEPPSLLGHLGPQTSRYFIHMLLDLDKPLDNNMTVIAIWRFMSVVVSSRQQWFSIYLLTGRPPREALKDSNNETQIVTTRTLLKLALDILSNIESLEKPKALAMLEFISLAQNFWPWAMSDLLQKHSNFIKSISRFVAGLEPVSGPVNEDRMIESCYQNRMAAYIAEVLAMYLYHSRQAGNTAPQNELLQQIGFYTRCAVAVPQYNSSLHGNLRRNFETKFTGCTLQNFKRTKLETREFGREYFYDTQFAGNMLSTDQAWIGRRNDGLAEELAKANVNLSLVDAQVALLHGWKLLAIELSNNLSARPDLQVTMARIVKECLVSNNRSQLPENIFARLNQTRANFALIILQQLVQLRCTKPEVLGLLLTIWETIRNLDTSFELLLTSGDADYYRVLLKMLFLALRAHSSSDQSSQLNGPPKKPLSAAVSKIQSSSTTVQTVLDVLSHVVARGFRDLVAAIHERPAESAADDIAVVTAILQACLRVPGIEFSYNQILERMTACDVARVATTLFSWSDKLAIDGDPVYGELSVLFLLELSSIPAIAEQLAVEGVLGHISNASITSYIRKANVSSLTEGLGPQRCYSIWVRGILPLLLNILDAVGASVAAEVALFLNQFPKLLQQSVDAIDVPHMTVGRPMSPPRITYAMASEVHSLALVLYLLSTFRASSVGITEVPEVKWDNASVLDSVEHWLTERAVLRERILPLGLREMEMAKQKPSFCGAGYESRLEEKVVGEFLGVKDVLTGGET